MPFRDITGHHRLLERLSRAIARDTLPPSMLFAGPPGVGKRRTAGAVAEALNCQQPVSSEGFERDACGVCSSCLRIARGVYPDVLTLAPDDTGALKIDEIREAVDRAGYRPFEGRRRVVVIDEADAMAPPAQSALLKTLEEPPASSVFLLVSSMPDVLLPTVRSRCSMLRFGGLTPREVADELVRAHGYDARDAHAAASEADGSIGRALAARSVDLAEARAAAQAVLEQTARGTNPLQRLDAAKELARKGADAAEERDRLAVCLRLLSALLRDVGLLASEADPRVLANQDLQDEIARLARHFSPDRSRQAFAAVDEALAALERNASPKVVADWVALQL
jgi:DNA polymerase-3 subunit delta'